MEQLQDQTLFNDFMEGFDNPDYNEEGYDEPLVNRDDEAYTPEQYAWAVEQDTTDNLEVLT